jgi:DNA-binding MurR/RpiR family transcriptional regulator
MMMSAPADFDALKNLLIQIKPDLPKRLQQVAAFALDHPQEMALGTASSIAARAEVQASTLVRFAQAIGFGGFRSYRRCSARTCAIAGPIIPSG